MDAHPPEGAQGTEAEEVGRLLPAPPVSDLTDDRLRDLQRCVMSGMLAPQPRRRRRVVLAAFAVLIVAAIGASAFLVTTHSSAGADERAIVAMVTGYVPAEASASDIPTNAVAIVQERLARLAKDGSKPVLDDQKVPVAILPASAREAINAADAACLKQYCSRAYQRRHADDEPLADVVEAGLYNNPQNPLLLREDSRVLAAVVMKTHGDSAIVWTYSWFGDVTTKGHGPQGWELTESGVVKEAGQWRIDWRAPLFEADAKTGQGGASAAPDSSEWGPYSPHYSMVGAEQTGRSALYAGGMVPNDQVQAIENMALAGK